MVSHQADESLSLWSRSGRMMLSALRVSDPGCPGALSHEQTVSQTGRGGNRCPEESNKMVIAFFREALSHKTRTVYKTKFYNESVYIQKQGVNKKCCSYCREKVRGVSERAGTDHSVPCTIHGFHCFEFDLS